ncbi:hypothetical protein KEM48_006822 [Puccinia striiformis f. sp. tritici PST-130]|nr:hypothetical protein KEM48_006822 [Puccinia striiformis f. sp. tritici PST-130]
MQLVLILCALLVLLQIGASPTSPGGSAGPGANSGANNNNSGSRNASPPLTVTTPATILAITIRTVTTARGLPSSR